MTSQPQPDEQSIVDALRRAGCVFAEEEAALLLANAPDPAALASMVRQRAEGLPLEQILGWVEFCGRRIAVAPGVFVPRRRSELLATEAARLTDPGAHGLELCCGAAAIATVLASTLNAAGVHAADIDPVAVACARRNLERIGGHAYQGDLYDPLPAKLRGRFGVIVANAPYVPTDQIALMPPEARDHEPRIALDGGADGLDIQRRVIEQAPQWLRPGGHLLVETSQAQSRGTLALFAAHGFEARVARDDDLDATAVVGTLPAATMAA